MDLHSFYMGQAFDAYEYFGAHQEKTGFVFRTFAPNAARVTVTGEFNDWAEWDMNREQGGGIFTLCNINAEYGMLYKYCIYTRDGRKVEHCDPYGFGMELRPLYSSILTDLQSYQFKDRKWMENRQVGYDKPVNIYEMHMGSWKKKSDEPDGWYTYAEIADELIAYVKKNNYTHVEFMPLSEHPFDGSWGYQNTGFFAPTSRYGTPDELKELIDKCHQNDIGVIMDFVPVHFAVDEYALKEYDGTPLYEYPHSDVGESEWGSFNFIHSRREVCCFLQSAANYWLKEFHFDGLRIDAVSRLIYWQGDEKRGVNGNTLDFIKTMNQGLKERHSSIMLIAEDSTSYPGVTKAVWEGGLGFDYKWDLGFMHDTLEYFQSAPEYRRRDYHKLTFSMMYFYNERYMLEYCHDEVVHGKATILQKMHGNYEEKFPQARAMYLYMVMHPGKKLNFMGNEFGQLREWDETKEQDFMLLEYPMHDAFHAYMITLNEIYLTYPALSDDYKKENFTWIDCHQEERCIYAMERKKDGCSLVGIFNFSEKEQSDYKFAIEGSIKKTRAVLHSEWDKFGGTISEDEQIFQTEKGENGAQNVKMTLPPFSAVLLKVER